MAKLTFQNHYFSLQCHMILQKSLLYADLVLKIWCFLEIIIYFYLKVL